MDNKSNKLFINKTINSQDAYMKFLKFHSKTFNFSYILYTVFWSFLLTLCIFLAFRENSRIQGVLLTIALIAFIAYRFFKPKKIFKLKTKMVHLIINILWLIEFLRQVNIFTFMYLKKMHF